MSTSYGIIKFLMLTGLPMAAASILATLLIESRPMDLNELSHLTGYAKSHLSAMARLLEERKLIERIRLRGKKVLFRAKKEAIVSILRNHIDELRKALHSASSELEIHMESISRLEHGLSELLRKLEGEDNASDRE